MKTETYSDGVQSIKLSIHFYIFEIVQRESGAVLEFRRQAPVRLPSIRHVGTSPAPLPQDHNQTVSGSSENRPDSRFELKKYVLTIEIVDLLGIYMLVSRGRGRRFRGPW